MSLAQNQKSKFNQVLISGNFIKLKIYHHKLYPAIHLLFQTSSTLFFGSEKCKFFTNYYFIVYISLKLIVLRQKSLFTPAKCHNVSNVIKVQPLISFQPLPSLLDNMERKIDTFDDTENIDDVAGLIDETSSSLGLGQ